MKKIIVTGHGHYASGLKSALEMLAGPNEDLFFIDFEEADSEASLAAKMQEVLTANNGDEFVVFCDLLGGTPFKVAALFASQQDNIEVVAGANLASLLEITFSKESFDLPTLAEQFIATSKRGTMRFERNSATQAAEIDEEEGI